MLSEESQGKYFGSQFNLYSVCVCGGVGRQQEKLVYWLYNIFLGNKLIHWAFNAQIHGEI